MGENMTEESTEVKFLGQDYKLIDDDSKKFRFTCDQCGKCCKKVTVMINPYDIARMSDFLKISAVEFVKEYCNMNIGPTSKLPVLTLKTNPICKFNKGGLCTVYDARPVICRSFPVGRAQQYDIKTGETKERWMLNPNCSSIPLRLQKTWTIKEWVDDQKAREYYDVGDNWQGFLTELMVKKLIRDDDMFKNLFIMICYLQPDEISPLKNAFESMGVTNLPMLKEVKNPNDRADNAIAMARWLFITTKEDGKTKEN